MAGRERVRDDWTGEACEAAVEMCAVGKRQGRIMMTDFHASLFPLNRLAEEEFLNSVIKAAAERERDGKFGEHSSPDADVEFVGEQ